MKYHSLLPRERTERLNKRLTDGMMAALKTIHSATSPDSMAPSDLNRQRMGQEVLGRLISPPIGRNCRATTMKKRTPIPKKCG